MQFPFSDRLWHSWAFCTLTPYAQAYHRIYFRTVHDCQCTITCYTLHVLDVVNTDVLDVVNTDVPDVVNAD